jgi:hypothetical protein
MQLVPGNPYIAAFVSAGLFLKSMETTITTAAWSQIYIFRIVTTESLCFWIIKQVLKWSNVRAFI